MPIVLVCSNCSVNTGRHTHTHTHTHTKLTIILFNVTLYCMLCVLQCMVIIHFEKYMKLHSSGFLLYPFYFNFLKGIVHPKFLIVVLIYSLSSCP